MENESRKFSDLVYAEMCKNYENGCAEHNLKPKVTYNHIHCPNCTFPGPHDVRNHDPMWGDGDVHCGRCGKYLRMFDSG